MITILDYCLYYKGQAILIDSQAYDYTWDDFDGIEILYLDEIGDKKELFISKENFTPRGYEFIIELIL